MSSLKPITLHSHASGPNPWKVTMILEELSLPYNTVFEDFSKLKSEPYTTINPNGRVPAIVDPNTSPPTTLWESAACIQYLVDKYDEEGKISIKTEPEKYQQIQWLAYQVSGQGPYFGQAAWFVVFHHEKLPSAIERYQKEIDRVTAVLDSWLAKNDGWLVGGRCTYADLAFVVWALMAQQLAGDKVDLGKYAAYGKWMEAMQEREAVKKVLKAKKEAADSHGGH